LCFVSASTDALTAPCVTVGSLSLALSLAEVENNTKTNDSDHDGDKSCA